MFELTNTRKNYIPTKGLSNDQIQSIRKTLLGASDAPAIIGVNPFRSPLDVYLEKTNSPLYTPFEGNNRTKWGLLLEDLVAKDFANEKGYKVYRDNKIRLHKDYDFISCSLDRVIIDPEKDKGNFGIIEVKTMNSMYWNSLKGELPIAYTIQLQQQFAVTGFKWGYVIVFVLDECRTYEFYFEPDEEYIKLHIKKLVEFYNNHILKNDPPAYTAIDTTKEHFRFEPSTMIQACEEISLKHQRYIDLNKEVKEKSKELDSIKDELKEALQDKEKLIYNDKVIANWTSKINFDSTRLKSEHPDLYKQYQTKEIKSFYVKEIK